MMMLDALKKYVNEHRLFSSKDRILLAVSGGIDSMTMAHLFLSLGNEIAIAHSNFQLRETDSIADERFVENFAKTHHIPFFSVHFETSAYAKKHGISIQMAARELRYNWFTELMNIHGFDYCATAHHQNDSIETFFINLLRGTGISGLHGILPRQGKYIRPMLFVKREELETFAAQNHILFREDISNRSVKYLRNKIRHELIPLCKEINPYFEQTMFKNMQLLQAVENVFQQQMQAEMAHITSQTHEGFHINTKKLLQTPEPKTVLYQLLSPYLFTAPVVEQIIDSLSEQSGKQFFSPTHRLIKDRQELIVQEVKHSIFSPVEIHASEFPFQIQTPIFLDFSLKSGTYISKKAHVATLDMDKLSFPLTLRKWENGDFFYPFGMKQKQKLSDYFSDHHFSIPEKENTWLLCSGKDIVWLVGHRVDNRFAVDDTTIQTLCIAL